MPKARSHDLKMHFCLFVSNCLGFLLGDLDSYFMQEMMSIQVCDRRPKMLSGTSKASLAAKRNCKTTLKILFYKSKKIHCSAGLRPIFSNIY